MSQSCWLIFGNMFSRGDLTALSISQVSLPSVVSSVECQDGGWHLCAPRNLLFCQSVLPAVVFVTWNNCELTYCPQERGRGRKKSIFYVIKSTEKKNSNPKQIPLRVSVGLMSSSCSLIFFLVIKLFI